MVTARPRHFFLVVLAAASAALVVAGCGDDSGGDKVGHADLVQQANAACKTAEAKIAKIASPTTPAGLATYATQMAAATDELHDTIADLKPSEATDQQTMAAYTAGLARANAALTAMGAAAKAGDTGRVKAQAAQIEKISVGVLAARAGLSGCATSVTPSSTS